MTKNFTEKELTKSITAKRLGIDNSPNDDQRVALKALCENILQPSRDRLGHPLIISSGLRGKKLNKAIGGSKTSQHMKGEAVDIDQDGSGSPITNSYVFFDILHHSDFDQLIWEFGDDEEPDWVHVSYTKERKNRNQILIAYREDGKTRYKNWTGC